MCRSLVLALAALAVSVPARAQQPWERYTDAFEVRFDVRQPVITYVLRVDSADLSAADVPDLRIFARELPGEGGLSLIVTDPASIWGNAGLTPAIRSRLLSLRMGDTVRLEVRRPSGIFRTTVVIAGFDRPVVRIQAVPGVAQRQRSLRTPWSAAAP